MTPTEVAVAAVGVLCPVCELALDTIIGVAQRQRHVEGCARIEVGLRAASAQRRAARELQAHADADRKGQKR